jgi:uncharacterized protein (DUF1919 family)
MPPKFEGNHTAPATVSLHDTTAERDLEVFDKLPRTIKVLLWDAPFNMSAEYIAKQVRTCGRRAVKREYAEDCAKLVGQVYVAPVRRPRQPRTYR